MSVISLVRGPANPAADGVGDYCRYLASALAERGHQVTVTAVDWDHVGRPRALYELLSRSGDVCPDWTIIQHTHLSWSRRGFPLFVILAALALRRRTLRLGVVIHDPLPFGGIRWRDALRRATQVVIMRWLTGVCDAVVVTVPLEVIPWLRGSNRNVTYIPVGSNIPSPQGHAVADRGVFEVAVFGVSLTHREELLEIARVVRSLVQSIGRFRLTVLGRGSEDAAIGLSDLLGEPLPVDLETTGVLPEAELGLRLASADALLFVRIGGVSSRRGTAAAALAAGLPVIGYAGPETAGPIKEAGVILTPPGDAEAAARALERVARDPGVAQTLKRRNRLAYHRHFAWSAVAENLERALHDIAARG